MMIFRNKCFIKKLFDKKDILRNNTKLIYKECLDYKVLLIDLLYYFTKILLNWIRTGIYFKKKVFDNIIIQVIILLYRNTFNIDTERKGYKWHN